MIWLSLQRPLRRGLYGVEGILSKGLLGCVECEPRLTEGGILSELILAGWLPLGACDYGSRGVLGRSCLRSPRGLLRRFCEKESHFLI